jgi:8-oxo-dGTP diphosphatase
VAWLAAGDMDPEVFPAADRPIITALRLPQRYLITGADASRPESFLRRLSDALDGGARMVQLRAHGVGDAAYGRLAREAHALCEAAGARLLLNREPSVAAELPGHGLHLTASRLTAAKARPAGPWEWVGASCHHARDLARAADLGLDYALLGPVLPTASHPGAATLGWDGFARLADVACLPVYALGGLGPGDLDRAVSAGAQGVAAIRGFWR